MDVAWNATIALYAPQVGLNGVTIKTSKLVPEQLNMSDGVMTGCSAAAANRQQLMLSARSCGLSIMHVSTGRPVGVDQTEGIRGRRTHVPTYRSSEANIGVAG